MFVAASAAVLFASAAMFLAAPAAHAAAPTMTASTITADTNTDGTVDRVTVFFSEASDLDDTGGAADGFTSLAFNSSCTIVNGDYTGAGVLSKAFTLTGCTADDTSLRPTVTYTSVASCATNFSICDDAEANQMANGASRQAADGAGPVLMASSTVTNLKTGVSRTGSFTTFTFSEEPASITLTNTPNGTFSTNISTNTVAVTITGALTSGRNALTVATAPDAAANVYAGVQTGDTTLAAPLVYFVQGTNSGSTGSTSTTAATYTLELTAPAAGESYVEGDLVDLKWTSSVSSGTSAMSVIDVYLSVDNGATWELVADNTSNDGSYTWQVGADMTNSAKIKLVGSDGVTELATATSNDFSLNESSMSDDEDEDDYTDDEDDSGPWQQDDDGVGISPYNGMEEAVDTVAAGWYIRGEHYDTVYYIEDWQGELVRRPFYDAQTYFTYEDDFDAVHRVTDATLSTLRLVSPMLPKAGVVLVKIQSDARVFALEQDGDDTVLRWITSEEIAVDNYGGYWADYVIDVSPTLFAHFVMGEDLDSEYRPDMPEMKRRVELN